MLHGYIYVCVYTYILISKLWTGFLRSMISYYYEIFIQIGLKTKAKVAVSVSVGQYVTNLNANPLKQLRFK